MWKSSSGAGMARLNWEYAGASGGRIGAQSRSMALCDRVRNSLCELARLGDVVLRLANSGAGVSEMECPRWPVLHPSPIGGRPIVSGSSAPTAAGDPWIVCNLIPPANGC
jgi:hypothetical protein